VSRWALGLDLGQSKDYAALVAVEDAAPELHARHVERIPLRTKYPAIVERACLVHDALPAGSDLVVDGTGVGRPVVDMLREKGRNPVPVTICGGEEEREGEGGYWRVGKTRLVLGVVTAVEAQRLKIAKSLPQAATIAAELRAFRRIIRANTGTRAYEGQGEHDDLVLALALAVWRLRPT
jgi:hypothetical protein